MTVTLPATGYAAFTAQLMDFGGLITPALGGIQQRVNRIGNRWGLTVTLPPLRMDDVAMGWVADLNAGLTEGVIARWPQVDFTPIVAGTPLVNSAGQTGSTLIVDGFTPNSVMRKGQFFNVVVGGRHYLYQMRSPVVLSAVGAGMLPLLPMLRASPADNAVLRVEDPVIEGFLQGDGSSWTIERARTVGLSFTVAEAR
jgi:hypothetical protein